MLKSGFVLMALLLIGAAPSIGAERVRISKEGKTYVLGSKAQGQYKTVCESGDFEKVLAGAAIPVEMKKEFLRYNCEERSTDKVQSLYGSLTPEQKKSLEDGFQHLGYEINPYRCACD